jgi:hypothetical protein
VTIFGGIKKKDVIAGPKLKVKTDFFFLKQKFTTEISPKSEAH